MEPLDQRFSRTAFDALTDPHELSRALEHELRDRLLASTHRMQTMAWLLDALRSIGHDLYSFDEDGEGWAVWTDDWVAQQSARRTMVELNARDHEPITVCRGSWFPPVRASVGGP